MLAEGLTEAATDTTLRLHIGISLALSRRFTSGWAAALDDVRAMLPALEDLADEALLVQALNVAAFLGRGVGDPDAPAFAARAREIAGARGNLELGKEWTALLGMVLVDRGEHAEARGPLERDYQEWRERDERVAADVLRELGLARALERQLRACG